jgi:hypothetical protein
MAIKRKLDVAFLRAGCRDTQAWLPVERPASEACDPRRRQAFLTYGLPVLRVLSRDVSIAHTPRDLFDAIRDEYPQAGFPAVRLAIEEAYDQHYVELAGKDPVYGDPLYAITRLGLSVAPTE